MQIGEHRGDSIHNFEAYVSWQNYQLIERFDFFNLRFDPPQKPMEASIQHVLVHHKEHGSNVIAPSLQVDEVAVMDLADENDSA